METEGIKLVFQPPLFSSRTRKKIILGKRSGSSLFLLFVYRVRHIKCYRAIALKLLITYKTPLFKIEPCIFFR